MKLKPPHGVWEFSSGVSSPLHTLPCAMPFHERGTLFLLLTCDPLRHTMPLSRGLPETPVHYRADLTQPHRFETQTRKAYVGNLLNTRGRLCAFFCLLGIRRREGAHQSCNDAP